MIRLNGATSEEDRYLALAGNVIELAVRDAIKNSSKNASDVQKDIDAQRADAAIGWMNTSQYDDYCDMIGISPVRIRRGVHEFNEKKKS